MSQIDRAPAHGLAAGALAALLSTVVVGLLSVAMVVATATIAYPGVLSVFVVRGIACMLLGSIAIGVISAWLGSATGVIAQVQNSLAVVIALFTTRLAAAGPADERSFTTVWAFLAATTLAIGVAAWVVGRLRFGSVARYMPYPVVSGFLSATGYLLVMGGLATASRTEMSLARLPELFAPGAPIRWVPWALVAVLIVGLMRRLRRPMVLPLGLLAAGGGFFLVLVLLGIGVDEAGRMGLLLGPFGGNFLASLQAWRPTPIDGWALVAGIPTALSVIGLALISIVLSASSVEVATGAATDADRDLRANGIGNIVAAGFGSVGGHTSLSLTLLADSLRLTGPATGLIGAGAAALTLLFGAPLVGALPVGLFGAAIIVVGLNMLLAQLVDGRDAPRSDYLVVVIITLVTAVLGFLWGVLVGLVCAAIFFVVAFARIDVVRLVTNCGRLPSRTERSQAEQARLAALGSQVAVYGLEGYLFFGTAYRLVQRIEAALAAPSAPRRVLLDLTRVRGLDSSAAQALASLAEQCRQLDVELRFAGLPRDAERRIRSRTGEAVRFAPTLEAALEQIEATLLADDDATGEEAGGIIEALAARHPGIDLDGYFERVSVEADSEVIAQGAPADSLIFLDAGLLRVEVVGGPGAPVTVARCLPGALVGEIGLYAGVPRTARVVSAEPSRFRRIDTAALDRMAEAHPALLADLHRLIAAALARRLQRTTGLLVDAEILGE
jgi:SulP family sulfate permease